MDDRLNIWIRELRRYNGRLHLMGPSMLKGIEEELEVMLPLLRRIKEPVLADLGSGSGLPAIPYKLLHPASHILLIERSIKKCTFLQHILELLNLTDMEILPNDPLHDEVGQFEAILARSFSPLSTLEDVCLKILKPGGRLYYLFTAGTPELAQPFALIDVILQRSQKYTLNLAKFNRLP
jgi:16S rRNA (guanine527-N7)-methyltransferase